MSSASLIHNQLAIHILTIYLETYSISILYCAFSAPFQRPEKWCRLLSPAIHQQWLQIFPYFSLKTTLGWVPCWPRLSLCLELPVIHINTNITLCILFMIRRIMFNHKTNNSLQWNTFSSTEKKKHKFNSQSEAWPHFLALRHWMN